MIAKSLIFVLLFLAGNLFAQKITPKKPAPSAPLQSSQLKTDELSKHLSAAETYQLSGDLINAANENRTVIGIGLHRLGNVEIEEGNYKKAVDLLNESKQYRDTAETRTNLAVAYLRLNQLDKALEEARFAVEIDPKFSGARYVLGNIYFTKEDYKSALPELEKVLHLAPDFDSTHALGLTYLHLKQAERAKLLFEEIQTSIAKDSPELHILFGQAYEKTNYPLEAEREFKRALAINPNQPRASFFLGYVILQHGGSERLAEAAKAFERELKLTPDDFYANFFAGVTASSESEHQKAIRFLEKAVKSDPARSAPYLFLGQSQLEMNDLLAAEKSLRWSIDLSKDDASNNFESRRTHFLLGRLLIKTGRKEEGEKELIKARDLQEKSIDSARDEISQILGNVVGQSSSSKIDRTAENQFTPKIDSVTPARAVQIERIRPYLSNVLAQAFQDLAVIDVKNEKTDEALEKFASAAKWKPDFPGLNRNWGIVNFRAGKFDRAIGPLEQQLRSNPKDNLIRRMLGASYYFTGTFGKVAEVLKMIEAELINDPELAYFYGISLVQLKRNQEAFPIFNRLALASQNKAESLFYAAQGFMFLGDYERAVREFKTVIVAAPNTLKANDFIGQSLIRLNRHEEAGQAFARELELNPADASSKYHFAITLIERKIETEKAIKNLEEAINLKSDYADARYQLGKIFLEKGETQKAIDQLEAAVSVGTKKDFIHYQLSIAYRRASRKDDADRELKRYQELKAANRKIDSPMGDSANSPN